MYTSIGKELQVSFEAVRKRLLAAAERGDAYPRSPPGRQPLPPRKVRRIYRDLLFHPWRTFREIAKDHEVGPKMVRNIATQHFLFRFVAKKKPYLTHKARMARRAWVKEAEVADWGSIIWTDECMVRIGDRGRK